MRPSWLPKHYGGVKDKEIQMIYNHSNNTYLVINPRGQIKGIAKDGKAVERPGLRQEHRAGGACYMGNTKDYIVFYQVGDKIVPHKVASDLSSTEALHMKNNYMTGELHTVSVSPTSSIASDQHVFLLTKEGTIYQCVYGTQGGVDENFSYKPFFSMAGSIKHNGISIPRPPKKILAINENEVVCLTSSERSVIALHADGTRRSILREQEPLKMYRTHSNDIIVMNKRKREFHTLYRGHPFNTRANKRSVEHATLLHTRAGDPPGLLMLSEGALVQTDNIDYFLEPDKSRLYKITDCKGDISGLKIMSISNTDPDTYKILISTPNEIKSYEFKDKYKKSPVATSIKHTLSELETVFNFKVISDSDVRLEAEDSKMRKEDLLDLSSDDKSICVKIQTESESAIVPRSFLC